MDNIQRNVSILSWYFPPQKDSGRGMERFSFELVKGLRDSKRYKPIVLTHEGKSGYSFFTYINHCIKLYSTKTSIYHAVDIINGMSGVISGKHPLITHIHDIHPFVDLKEHPELKRYFSGVKGSIRRKAGILSLKKSDVLITPFPSNKQFILDKYDLDDEKIRVIPYGVDTTVFRPLEVPIKKDKKLILCVSSLLRERGIEDLILAFYHIKQEIDNVNLIIIGKGEDQNYFKKLVTKLKLNDKVRFLGFVPDEDLSYYYNIADVFVLPSKLGFSLACLEAMACGSPVITADSYDARDILEDAAVIVKPGEYEQLSRCIIEILTDDKIKKGLRKKSIKLAQNYTWQKTVQNIIHVYDILLGV